MTNDYFIKSTITNMFNVQIMEHYHCFSFLSRILLINNSITQASLLL